LSKSIFSVFFDDKLNQNEPIKIRKDGIGTDFPAVRESILCKTTVVTLDA